ncbi:FLYWCH zinc finger domain protein [Oopsacas minuta]|uniref:FLYWCH zinc finger domain protein n=1 Tax=Oopsacas minuta TaxID=111878 RepID=A0AAV7KAS6_9METZ|nr:FLYWCH zinc finger domain protein [Oopsacas minuta]
MSANSDTSFQMIKSSKGTNKLSHDGYLYIFHRRGAIKKEWRSDVRGCKDRIHSVDETIIKKSREHSHQQEYGKDEVTAMKDLMRKRARETNDNPHVTIGEMTSLLSGSAKSLLPNQHALKMMYKRQRIAPPNPVYLEELQLDAENIKTFLTGTFYSTTLALPPIG